MYDGSSEDAERAALSKNLAQQVPAHPSGTLFYWVSLFLTAFARGAFDAWRAVPGDFVPASPEEVVAAAFRRSGKKGRAYEAAFAWWYKAIGWCRKNTWIGTQAGSMFVKLEALKPWKPPRMVFNPETVEVAASRQTTMLAETWKYGRPTFSGLPTPLRYLPIADAAAALDPSLDCYILSLDDTGRDANTTEENFIVFRVCLFVIGSLLTVIDMLLLRRGFVAKMKNVTVRGAYFSLLSGSAWTSIMNYFTSLFNLFCFALFHFGWTTSDYVSVAEGDDSALVFPARLFEAASAKGLFEESAIYAFGLLLRKRIKVESLRHLKDPRGHPIVGGVVVHFQHHWFFFPSWSRFLLKSGWALDRNIVSATIYRGRLKARSCALNDRYTGVPVMWAYAQRVHANAILVGGRTRFTAEEEFSYSGVVIAQPPSDLARDAFASVYGLSVSLQLEMEAHLRRASAFEDLTVDPYWLELCRRATP